MITINKVKQTLTLKPLFKTDKCHQWVIKKDGVTTLISEEKMLFVYFNQEKISKQKLFNFMVKFAANNTYDLNINIGDWKISNEVCSGQAVIEGLLYGLHKPYTLKTGESKDSNNEKTINIISDCKEIEKDYAEAAIKMEFVNFARDLQDTPPNILTAPVLADAIAQKAKTISNVKVTILTKKEIEANKMGLLLGVNAGSHVEPRVIVLEYTGDNTSKEKVGLIGKGITFDSGGYNLKPSEFMHGMKFDMSGAAIMCSSLMAIAKAKLKVNAVAIGCLTDNRIGGQATLPESVLTAMNGKTVQINNTDAEGRLVLADGITYAISKCNATKIIEASTLTGAILVALGRFMTGVFANNDEWYNHFAKASGVSGEEIWRMPIHEDNFAAMHKTPIADLTNVSTGRYGGSSTAAAFLCEFVEDKPYLHLDIAGTADNEERGTGVMLRTIFSMFK